MLNGTSFEYNYYMVLNVGALSSLTSTRIKMSEERRERLTRLQAIQRAQYSIVTNNVSNVNDIVEDEVLTFTSNEQVQ